LLRVDGRLDHFPDRALLRFARDVPATLHVRQECSAVRAVRRLRESEGHLVGATETQLVRNEPRIRRVGVGEGAQRGPIPRLVGSEHGVGDGRDGLRGCNGPGVFVRRDRGGDRAEQQEREDGLSHGLLGGDAPGVTPRDGSSPDRQQAASP
jgi:hypothetical protein